MNFPTFPKGKEEETFAKFSRKKKGRSRAEVWGLVFRCLTGVESPPDLARKGLAEDLRPGLIRAAPDVAVDRAELIRLDHGPNLPPPSCRLS